MKQINIFGIMALLLISFAVALVVITNFVVRMNPPSLAQKHIEDKTILDESELPTDIVNDNVVHDSVVKDSKKEVSSKEEMPIPVLEEPIEIEEPSKPYYPQEDFQSGSLEMMEEKAAEKEEFILHEENQKAISDVKAVPGGNPQKSDNYFPGSFPISPAATPLSQKASGALPPPAGSSVPGINSSDSNNRDNGTNRPAGSMKTPGPPPSSVTKIPGSKPDNPPSTLPQFDSQFSKNGPVR